MVLQYQQIIFSFGVSSLLMNVNPMPAEISASHREGGNSAPIQQFLSFSLTQNLQAVVDTSHLSEIFSLDLNQIVPIFHLPEAVMGVFNHRGEVLWIVDLACLLGLDALFVQNYCQACFVLVLQHQRSRVGFAVRHVGQLIGCLPSAIQPLQSALGLTLTAQLLNGLAGWHQSAAGERLLVLDSVKTLDLLKC